MITFVSRLIIVVLVLCIKIGHSLPDGAPIDACESMTPHHDENKPKVCQPNYIIESDKYEYNGNDAIRVRVRGLTSADRFKGILLIAKDQNSQQVLGSWSTSDSSLQTISCNGIQSTGITHKSAADKSQVQAVWHAPSNIFNRATIIKATIVKSYNEIYVDCFQITLTPRQNRISIRDDTSTPAMGSTSMVTPNTGIQVNWTYAGGVTSLKMSINNLKRSQWVAFGLSLDNQMGDDHVFLCQQFSNDTVVLARYLNPGGHQRPVPVTPTLNPGGTFDLIRQGVENNVAYFEFTLSNFTNTPQSNFTPLSQTQSYHPLFAFGMLNSSSNILMYHTTRVPQEKLVQLNQPNNIQEAVPAATTPAVSTTTRTPTSEIGIQVNWTYAGGVTRFQMSINNLKRSQWMAVGLSLDDQMGDDHVFICQQFSNDTVVLARYLNPGGHQRPVPVTPTLNPGGTFDLIRQGVENNVAYFEFTLSNFTNTPQSNFTPLSQTQSYHPLFAFGMLNSSSNILMYHTTRVPQEKLVQLDQPNNIVYPTTTAVSTTTRTPTSEIGIQVNWTYAGGVTRFQMSINNLKRSQWVAVGLSSDDQMGDDHVFICQQLSDDTIVLARYVNPGGHRPPETPSSNSGGTFNLTLQRVDNNVAYFEFTLSDFTNTAHRQRRQSGVTPLSQTNPYHPLIAFGMLDSSNVRQRHTTRVAQERFVQLNQANNIVYNIQTTGNDRSSLKKAHGIIMIITWILFVSTGILIARYFKLAWPDRKLCGKAIWFAMHRSIMSLSALLTLIAFVLILVYRNGTWIPRSSSREFVHSIVGILVISFAVIQPFMALFRCNPKDRYRYIFNYAHATVGLSAFILSIVAIFLAFFFDQFNFEIHKEWAILVGYACWIVVVFFTFECIEFCFRKDSYVTQRVKSDSIPMQSNESGTDRVHESIIIMNPLKDRLKAVLLVLHIVVVFGLALALAIVVGQTTL